MDVLQECGMRASACLNTGVWWPVRKVACALLRGLVGPVGPVGPHLRSWPQVATGDPQLRVTPCLWPTCLCPPTYPPTCPPACPPTYPPTCLSTCPPTCSPKFPMAYPTIYPTMYPPIFPIACLTMCPPMCLAIRVPT
jgi:hypothetical protein